MLWPIPPPMPGLTLMGKLKIVRSLSKALGGLKKMTPSAGSVFGLVGSWGP